MSSCSGSLVAVKLNPRIALINSSKATASIVARIYDS